MEEKEIAFTTSEIEHLQHICNEILANDPTQNQAQSILQKLSSVQHSPDDTSEEIPVLVKRRGRKPKMNATPAEITPEGIAAMPKITPAETIHEIEKTPEVIDLEVVKEVPAEKPTTKLKFIQNLLQRLRPAI